MPLVQTRGAASAQGFGEFAQAAVAANYIEEVFSTFLYTGNGSTGQSIVNNIDLSGKGGLVWCKSRSSSISHGLSDTVTGRTKALRTNNFANQVTTNDSITSFNSNGFSLGNDLDTGWFNTNLANYVSWTFREQPKFFDIVTWTGNASNRTIAHSLGSVPGCIIVKRRDDDADWQVYHRSLANTEYLVPNTTAAKATGATRWNSTTPTSAVFSLGTDASVNASAGTYVAYLFAHDAGGFGLTGTDNVISCGTFTTTSGYSPNVELGYEPQWIMLKRTDASGNWLIVDTMRGWVDPAGTGANDANLRPDLSDAEATNDIGWPYATGFNAGYRGGAESTWIYVAIRRGPMKVPTVGTTVFSPQIYTGTNTTRSLTSAGFPIDLVITDPRSGAFGIGYFDRLRGATKYLNSAGTGAEGTGADSLTSFASMNGYTAEADNDTALINYTPNYVNWMFRRTPSFFDEVCYTGNGGINNVQNHSLADSIGMLIIKRRDSTGNWSVFVKESGGNYSYWNSSGTGTGQGLNGAGAATGTNYSGYNSYLTSTTFNAAQIAGSNDINANGGTYVAYLFATCAGVSKVGSYTGTATTLQIDCGFTGGARFVLIKRTDSTGAWYVWDTARGIVSGNDSYLLLNSTAAEVTNTDYIDTYSAGFEISSTAPAAINASGGTFIFFAVA